LYSRVMCSTTSYTWWATRMG